MVKVKIELLALLRNKIKQTNIDVIKADVLPFIKKNPEDLSIWSMDYFTQRTNMIRFE
jgi:hypothetical protein